MIRIVLPAHLNQLAGVRGEVLLPPAEPATFRSVVQSLEQTYPALTGTLVDPATRKRRPFVRFFAEAEDWSHHDLDTPLPTSVQDGREPLLVVGAIAGGSVAV